MTTKGAGKKTGRSASRGAATRRKNSGKRKRKPARPAEDVNLSRAWFFKDYRTRAREYIANPTKLRKLASTASAKLKRTKREPLRNLVDQVQRTIRLVRAYANGSYREISKTNAVLLVAGIVYFVTPTDLVPDFIAGIGYVDDAAVLALVFRAVGDELDRFEHWELR
jgi:uncharacterized membrane protein YkvA (DUF1232 family)